nr:hypothetical protein [Acinetobacter sp. NEB149]
MDTWDNLQADFFDFYGQALNKLAFDDVVTLIHLLNKVNDGLKSIHLHKETGWCFKKYAGVKQIRY